jgi:hypothetical protein
MPLDLLELCSLLKSFFLEELVGLRGVLASPSRTVPVFLVLVGKRGITHLI